MDEVKNIFEPESVVLVGSSSIRERVGMASPQLFNNVAYNMKRYFKGEVLVIDVEEKDMRTTLHGAGQVPALAVVMLPPDESLWETQKLAELGVKAFVLITGGYKNHQRKRLLRLKQKYGVRILGPNTIMGVINSANGLNTTFEKGVMPKKGSVAVVSQSGGVGACLLDWACAYNVGISKFAFMGDKIDVDDVDLIEYLAKDRETKVVCLYMEGTRDGRKLIHAAGKIVGRKPILVLKGGLTEEAAKRAVSHTSSIAGKDEVFSVAFKKAGMIRVEDIEELMNDALALSKQPPMLGDNVAVVSNVGGPAILAADAVAKSRLRLARLSRETKTEIERLYPGVDASNPIDMIADAKADRYAKVLELVLRDDNVDGVLVINMLKSTFFSPDDAKIIPKVAGRHKDKPVIDVPAGGDDFARVYRVIGASKVPLYNLPEKGVKALRVLRAYACILSKH
jgi:acyl-CoA synthetase (NDP forming)